jgi:class 3 adenylate cyclase
MEPRIQYAKTSDGVSIAFSAMGTGMPFVEMPAAPWTHVQAALQIPGWRSWIERLAHRMNHVWFDARGSGLSGRDISGVSLNDIVLDLEAVVDRLGLRRFALFGHHGTAAAALAFAAGQPDRVSHLVLWCPFARGLDLDQPATQAMGAILEANWETYVETFMHVGFGWAEGEEAHRAALSMREWVTPSMGRAYWKLTSEADVTDLLPSVMAPTLILQRRQYVATLETAMDLASRLPNAQMALLEGTSGATYVEDMEAVVNAIEEFLGVSEDVSTDVPGLPSGTAIILFADIVGSTALTEKLGDAAFRAKARELDTTLRAVIRECSGTPVEGKLLGDGVLAVFTSARQAIDCALRCNGAGETVGLALHLGVHAGDVIREGNNVYGGAVNIAARIAGASAPGEVLVSDTVRGLARTSAGVTFDDRGEQSLKGIEEPQRLFAVREGA